MYVKTVRVAYLYESTSSLPVIFGQRHVFLGPTNGLKPSQIFPLRAA